MTDTNETPDPEEQVQVAPEEDASPAWKFGPEQEDVTRPIGISPDDVRQILREELGEPREPDYEEQLVNRAVERAAQAMQAQMNRATAPAARREIVEDLTVGLGPSAKQYLSEYFQGYTPDVIDKVREHKPTMDMLRRAAEYEHSKSTSRAAPRSESTVTTTEVVDTQFERELESMWNNGFKNVHGLTKEKFREEMKRRVS